MNMINRFYIEEIDGKIRVIDSEEYLLKQPYYYKLQRQIKGGKTNLLSFNIMKLDTDFDRSELESLSEIYSVNDFNKIGATNIYYEEEY